jgi:fibronectin-binding autotransporter adhesin
MPTPRPAVLALGLSVAALPFAPVAPAAAVIWDASGDSTWSQPDATSWSGDTYTSGDSVVFADTGVDTITLAAGTLTPQHITFNHTTGTYFLGTGGGAMAATGNLVVNGAGSVQVGNLTNSPSGLGGLLAWTGSTEVSGGGTLALTRPGTLGGAGQTVTLNNGALLVGADNSSTYTTSNPFSLGAGGGTLVAQYSGNQTQFVFSGDFSGAGDLALRLSGGGGNLANSGVVLSGSNGGLLGPVEIRSHSVNLSVPSPATSRPTGAVYFANSGALFSGAPQVNVRDGGVLGVEFAVSDAQLANAVAGPRGGLAARGASGSLTGLSNPLGHVGPGGVLVLDNFNAITDRLANAGALPLQNQQILVIGRNASNAAVNEQAGALSLAGGNHLFLNRRNSTNSGVVLTAASLATPIAGQSLLVETGTSVGEFGTGASNSSLVITGSKPAAVNGMITPAVQHFTGGNNAGHFVTYDAVETDKLIIAPYFSGFDSGSSTEIANVTTSPTLAADEAVHAVRVTTGSLTLSPGVTLSVGSGGIITSSTSINGAGGIIDFGATHGVIGAYNAAAQAHYAPRISGSAGLTVMGSTQTANFNNTSNDFTGGIFLNGGAARFVSSGGNHASNLNDVTVNAFGRLVAGGGAGGTDSIGGLSGIGAVSSWVSSSGSSAGTLNLAAPSGSYTFDGLMLNGAGSPRLFHLLKTGGATQTLTGSSTYTGSTTLNGGVLAVPTLANGGLPSPLGASSALAANLTLGGGTLRFTGLSGSTDRSFTLTSATTSGLDVANAAGQLTLNGGSALTSGNLNKLGDGTLILNGTNQHTGFTGISAGTLRLLSGGALANTAVVDFNAAANTPTLDLAGVSRDLGQLTNSGVGGNARINNSAGSALTLTVGPVFAAASVFDGQIHQSGGGAVEVRVGSFALAPASSLNLGGTGGNTFTGKVQVQPNATLIVSSGQESSLGLGSGADALHLNGGTLRVQDNDLTLNDPGRGIWVDIGNIGLGFSGGTFSVAPGRVLTLGNDLQASGIAVRKADAGTLNLTATSQIGTLLVLGGVADISAGTLRVNALTVAGGANLNWGNGRLELLNKSGADGAVDYSSPGGPEVRVGRTLAVTGDLASDPGAVLELHGSPTFYANLGIRFNQLSVSGMLNLSAANDTLEVDIESNLLRANTGTEYGSIPLVTAAQIVGTFDTFGTVTSGATFNPYLGVFTSAAALPDDTWHLEYADTNADLQADTLFFHYKLTAGDAVPEPSTAALLGAGVLALRRLHGTHPRWLERLLARHDRPARRRRRRPPCGYVLVRPASRARRF